MILTRPEIGARGRDELLAEAMQAFRKARKIAPHAGVVKSALRLFDELVKCDSEGLLEGVREAVEGVDGLVARPFIKRLSF